MNIFPSRNHLLFLIAGTLVMMVVMAKTGGVLKTNANPKGIVGFELAHNASEAQEIIKDWVKNGPANILHAARINTYFDFIFIFFYSFLFYTLCSLIAPSFSSFLFTFGRMMAKGCLIAGMADILENAGMLMSLQGNISDSGVLLTFLCSTIKWVLVFASLGYIVIAGAIALCKKRRNQR